MTSNSSRTERGGRRFNAFGRVALVVGLSGFAGVSATRAHADPSMHDPDAPSVAVSYSDLNLATEEGALTLYKRIVSAARQVCPLDTGPNMRLVRQARECVNDAIARAVNDIQSPRLAELSASRARRVDRG
jgi:UrcA family protein